MTESFVVTVLGAIAGLVFAVAGVRALQTLGAAKMPRLESIPFDARVLGFAALVLLASGVMLGVAPALRLARTDLKTLMNESGRSSSGGRATAWLDGRDDRRGSGARADAGRRRRLAGAEFRAAARDRSRIRRRGPAARRRPAVAADRARSGADHRVDPDALRSVARAARRGQRGIDGRVPRCADSWTAR